MVEVVDFKNEREQDWHKHEPVIRGALKKHGHSAHAIEWICAAVKALYLSTKPDETIRIEGPAVILPYMKDAARKALAGRARRETRLWAISLRLALLLYKYEGHLPPPAAPGGGSEPLDVA